MPAEDGDYTLGVDAPSRVLVTRIYFNYTVDAINATVSLKGGILYPIQVRSSVLFLITVILICNKVHLYGLKGGDSATLLWANGSAPPLQPLPSDYLFHSPYLLADFPRQLNVTNATSIIARRRLDVNKVQAPTRTLRSKSDRSTHNKTKTVGRNRKATSLSSSSLIQSPPLLLSLPAPRVDKTVVATSDEPDGEELAISDGTASRRLSDLPSQPIVVGGGNSENRITVKWDAVNSSLTPVSYTVLVDGQTRVSGMTKMRSRFPDINFPSDMTNLSYTLTPCTSGTYYDFRVMPRSRLVPFPRCTRYMQPLWLVTGQ